MTAESRRFSVFLVPAAEERRWAEGVIREPGDAGGGVFDTEGLFRRELERYVTFFCHNGR